MSQRGAFVLGPDLRIAQVLGADMASGSQIRQFRHRLVLLYLRESGNCLASCSGESSLIALRLGPTAASTNTSLTRRYRARHGLRPARGRSSRSPVNPCTALVLSLIHISEPTR